jgi:hypothetical protein
MSKTGGNRDMLAKALEAAVGSSRSTGNGAKR